MFVLLNETWCTPGSLKKGQVIIAKQIIFTKHIDYHLHIKIRKSNFPFIVARAVPEEHIPVALRSLCAIPL